MELHHLHPELLKHQVRVLVVGCGGNGSAVAAGLPYLHQALPAYGHPEGLHVTLLDPEVISPTNCVRQPFSQSEIGLYKSVVLANRLNLFWGMDWDGIPERLDPKRRLDGVDIVIGCVDTRKARAAIAKSAEDWSEVDYWLDLGNNADSGQFVLGEPLNRRNRRHKLRLRTVSELFPKSSKANWMKMAYRVAVLSKLWIGRSHSSTSPWQIMHWPCSRDCSARNNFVSRRLSEPVFIAWSRGATG
jgi:PRTRC genetic system ThiF family protein